MKTMLRPASRNRRSRPNSRSTSGGESAEVGSSRMMMRAPEKQHARDFHELLQTERQAAHRRRADRHRCRDLRDARLRSGAWPASRSTRSRCTGCAPRWTFSATLRSRHDRQFLMHHADPAGARITRRGETDRSPVKSHLALVVGVHAGDDLHQRGLARAVLADQAVDLARLKREIHRPQRRHAAEGLGDPGKFQQSRQAWFGHDRFRHRKSDQEVLLHPHHAGRVGLGDHRAVDDDVLRDPARPGLLADTTAATPAIDRAAMDAAGRVAHGRQACVRR